MARGRRRTALGRRTPNATLYAAARALQSDTQRRYINATVRNNMARLRASRRKIIILERAAFSYDATLNYAALDVVSIGSMSVVCSHCKAFKFKHETPGLCCANGQVKLVELNMPSEPLRSLLIGGTPESDHFLKNIQSYNACFQMTSFGATNIVRDNFMPTFKVNTSYDTFHVYFDEYSTFDCEIIDIQQIQGQVYHRLGSLLPFPDQSYQFLQIYFVGNTSVETNRRCDISSNLRRQIVERLQSMLRDANELVRLFQTALDRMPSDNHAIVISADKKPPGLHAGRFNAPTIDDVAIVIIGDEFNSRDIVLHRRNNQLQRVSETHRCYDALQYPLLFCRGEDGYHLNIKMRNASSG